LIFPDKASLYICAIEDGEYKNEKINFWDNVYGFDMSIMKNISIVEPLVDIVEKDAIISNCVSILDIDILTCKKEDLNFNSNFSLIFSRDDYCHALIAYFECEFSQIHKPLKFSTGPHAHPTHWKQTVFYIGDELVVQKGETIEGNVTCVKNKKNCRDLDINISYNFDGFKSEACREQIYKLR
jgi:protein arginine N-methyltransferase 1